MRLLELMGTKQEIMIPKIQQRQRRETRYPGFWPTHKGLGEAVEQDHEVFSLGK